MSINILVIGLGPHARRIHLPVLLQNGQAYGAAIKAIIDLASQKNVIEAYLADKDITPRPELLFLGEDATNLEGGALGGKLQARLDQLVRRHRITAIFVATEPAFHCPYASWALQRGLHVFMDKPISAPLHLATSTAAVSRITKDYLDLAQLYRQQRQLKPGLIFEVMAQRRYHPAFHEIDRRVEEVGGRTGVPITSFQSLHSDGQWRMPDEIVDQDYHPYNQGYGKLLHSGYHDIDITDWLVQRSYGQTLKAADIEVFANFVYRMPKGEVGLLPWVRTASYIGRPKDARWLQGAPLDAQLTERLVTVQTVMRDPYKT